MVDLPKGFKPISGNLQPQDLNASYYVALRNGYTPSEPWPVSSKSGRTNFIWDRDANGELSYWPWDIVGVRKA